MRVSFMIAGPLLGMLLLAGCATTSTSNDPVANTIYDMHRKVSRIDKDLGGTVTHLNETAADLGVRVNESNAQAREMQSTVEENRQKLAQLESKLDTLTYNVYKALGITTPSRSQPSTGWDTAPGTSDVQTGGLQVEPPSGAVTAPAASAPGLPAEPDPLAHTAPATPAPVETAAAAAPLDTIPAYNQAMEAYQRDQFDEALSFTISRRAFRTAGHRQCPVLEKRVLYNLGGMKSASRSLKAARQPPRQRQGALRMFTRPPRISSWDNRPAPSRSSKISSRITR